MAGARALGPSDHTRSPMLCSLVPALSAGSGPCQGMGISVRRGLSLICGLVEKRPQQWDMAIFNCFRINTQLLSSGLIRSVFLFASDVRVPALRRTAVPDVISSLLHGF